MGPQLYRCGNAKRQVVPTDRPRELQWGRNFIVAEITRRSRRVGCHSRASMGPQLYRCGNSIPILHPQSILNASMGPQLYRCGNLITSCTNSFGTPCFNGAATLSLRKFGLIFLCLILVSLLQWGRNFIVAEIQRVRHRPTYRPTLQWGRNFIVAEMWRLSASLRSAATCFNGAATLSLRKSVWICVQGRPENPASMGPQLYRCGNTFRSVAGCGCCCSFNGAATLSLRKCAMPFMRFRVGSTLQWGRNFIVAEMSLSEACRCRIPASFNGAATLSLRKCGQRPVGRDAHAALQWGRNFIVAEIFLPGYSTLEAMSFNGAATLSLRKLWTWL